MNHTSHHVMQILAHIDGCSHWINNPQLPEHLSAIACDLSKETQQFGFDVVGEPTIYCTEISSVFVVQIIVDIHDHAQLLASGRNHRIASGFLDISPYDIADALFDLLPGRASPSSGQGLDRGDNIRLYAMEMEVVSGTSLMVH